MSVLCCVHHWSSLFFNQLSSFSTAFLLTISASSTLTLPHQLGHQPQFSVQCAVQSCCWCSFSRFTCFGCCLSVWFVCWCVGDVVLFCLVLIWPLGLDRRRSSRHCCSIFFFFFVVIYIISAVCWYILERSEWVLFLLLMLQRTTLCLAVFSH